MEAALAALDAKHPGKQLRTGLFGVMFLLLPVPLRRWGAQIQ